jgi:hypothetical protein
MASVRMTQEMRSNIRRAAENAYELSNPEPKPNNAYIAAVKQAVLNSPEQKFLKRMANEGRAENLHLRKGKNLLPEKNKEDVTAVELRLASRDAGGNRDYKETVVQFDVPLSEYWVVEQTYNRWGNPTVYVNDLATEDKHNISEMFETFQDTVIEWKKASRNYNGSISDLLENCSTLKQLLEIWPAAESLVESEKLAKMHVKVSRKERAQQIKDEICFDPTIANQAVLTAKLLGG